MAKKLTEEERRLRYKGIAFERRYLVRDDFSGYNFTGSYLNDIMFMSANLEGAIFTDATLLDVDFSHANLTNADFTGAKLEGTINLTQANLSGAIFDKVEIGTAEVIGGNIAKAQSDQFDGVTFISGALPTQPKTEELSIAYLPDGVTIDGALTTNWPLIDKNARIAFGPTEYELNPIFTEFFTSVIQIMLPQRNNFEIELIGDQEMTPLSIAVSRDFTDNYRLELLGTQNLVPVFTSKRRIALKKMGWQGSEEERDLLGFHRDFVEGTPSRVFEEFVVQTIGALAFLGYPIGFKEISSVLKNEQEQLKKLFTKIQAQFDSESYGAP